MKPKRFSISPKEWLADDLETFKKDHDSMSQNDIFHAYILSLKQKIAERDKKIDSLQHGMDYSLRWNAKSLKYDGTLKRIDGNVGKILKIIEKQRPQQKPKEHHTRYEGSDKVFCKMSGIYVDPRRCQKCGTFNCSQNKNSKNPHLQKQKVHHGGWNRNPYQGWYEKVRAMIPRGIGLPSPFPCPFDSLLACRSKNMTDCMKNTPFKYAQCAKLKNSLKRM